MSKEEAIEVIQKFMGWFKSDSRIYKALKMAISAMLENEELSKDLDEALQEIDEYERGLSQEPCTDAVSRGVFEQVMWERDIAIEQLKELGYELGQKIEPCDDVISREAVIKLAYDMSEIDGEHFDKPCMVVDVEDIQKLPPVTQKSGKWVEIDDEPHEVWECDHCGFVIDGSGCIEPYEYRDIYKFCPNCGAEMESEE